jgi:hypothetical protein
VTPKERDHLLNKAREEVVRVRRELGIIRALIANTNTNDPNECGITVRYIKEVLDRVDL